MVFVARLSLQLTRVLAEDNVSEGDTVPPARDHPGRKLLKE